LVLWFIPVILIPLMWPAYSIWVGQFNYWLNDISYQTHRQAWGQSLPDLINTSFRIDPVLVILGVSGVIFSIAIKKDFFFLLWVIPYFIFLYLIGYVAYYYVIFILPAFLHCSRYTDSRFDK
jgi:hypothetical protein